MKPAWKQTLRSYVTLLLVAGVIILLDQLTKSWVRSSLPIGEIWSPWPWLTPHARIVHWYNTGVAFGLFQGRGQWLAILNIAISLAILYYFPRVPAKEWSLRLAMCLQLGGAIGNLIDRFTIGHVTDFISVGRFPVFNVADASITIGVLVLILGLWLQERSEARVSASASIEPQTSDES